MNEISYNHGELQESVTPLDNVQNEYSGLLSSLKGITLSSELTTTSLLTSSINSVGGLISSEIKDLSSKLANILSLANNIEFSVPNIFKRLFGLEDSDSNVENIFSVNSSIFYTDEYKNKLEELINSKLIAIGAKNRVSGIKIYQNGLYDHTSSDSLWIKLGNGERCFVNIKGDVSKDSPIFVINQGGFEGINNLDSAYINNYNIGSNGIYIRMMGSYGGELALDDAYIVTEAIAESLNVPVTNTVSVGFSGGGSIVAQLTADMCRNNKVSNPSFVLCDAYTKPIPFSQQNLQTLGDNGAIIYAVYHKGASSHIKDVYANWEEKYGINVVYMEVSNSGHEPTFLKFLNSGMLNYVTDDIQFPIDSIISSEIYNKTTKSWENFELIGKNTQEVTNIVISS